MTNDRRKTRIQGIIPALILSACVLVQPGLAQEGAAVEYEKATQGTRWLESTSSDLAIKILVEASNLGGAEVEVGEITFPPAPPSPGEGHLHGSIEIFYVLSGELDHIVNGKSHVLTPGMVGIVRPGDRVKHQVNSSTPVKALVIWAPGGEVDRLARFFEQRPVEEETSQEDGN